MSAVYLGPSERGWNIESCEVIGGHRGLESNGDLVVKNSIIMGF